MANANVERAAGSVIPPQQKFQSLQDALQEKQNVLNHPSVVTRRINATECSVMEENWDALTAPVLLIAELWFLQLLLRIFLFPGKDTAVVWINNALTGGSVSVGTWNTEQLLLSGINAQRAPQNHNYPRNSLFPASACQTPRLALTGATKSREFKEQRVLCQDDKNRTRNLTWRMRNHI